jgi:hypothetical protein
MSLPKRKCPHCGKEWTPRVSNPVKCPNPNCGMPLNSDLPPYADKEAKIEFPHIQDLFSSESLGLARESANRTLTLTIQQIESDAEILKTRRKILQTRSDQFSYEVNSATNTILEKMIREFTEDSATRGRYQTLEGVRERGDFIRKAITIIDQNLTNPRNLTIAKGEAYKDESGNVTRNAEIRLGKAPPNFITKELWVTESARLQDMRKLLQFALEMSERREKELENEIKARNEQRETTEKATVKEINDMVERAKREIKELGELSAKADRILQNGTIPHELTLRFRELHNDVNSAQHEYIGKVSTFEELVGNAAEVRASGVLPFPGIPHFNHEEIILKGQLPAVVPEPKKRKFPRLSR